MALSARRSPGCRAASWRRNSRGTSPGLLLTASPSPGGLTVAASGASKPGRSSAAAHSERSSPGCGPGGSTGWGRAGAESARSGLGAAVPRPAARVASGLGACRGPPRRGSGSGAGVPAPREGVCVGRCCTQPGDAGRNRSVPRPGAGVSRLLHLEKAHPGGSGLDRLSPGETTQLSCTSAPLRAHRALSVLSRRLSYRGFEGLQTHLLPSGT